VILYIALRGCSSTTDAGVDRSSELNNRQRKKFSHFAAVAALAVADKLRYAMSYRCCKQRWTLSAIN